jgi:GNAT superfamily N-acetyltransferase
MQFVDRALAVRLEAAEDLGQINFAQALAQTQPEVAIEAVAGGHVVFAGKDSPIGRAIGCGLTQPITPADLDFIEDFYFSRGAPARIDVPPLVDEGVFAMLEERGYRLEELNNVLGRTLAPGERFREEAGGIAIRRTSPTEAESCAAVLAACFSAPTLAPLLTPLFRAAELVLVAEADGKVVATGNGLIAPEHSMVALHGAGTLPEFRGRGIQTALLGRRLNAAVEAGCTLAVIVTRAGTISQRNAERLGFSLAYTKAVVKRSAAG